MECFNAMITNSEEHGLFLQLGSPAIKHCISLYADDVVAFVSSVEQDLILVKAILDTFFKATGLAANYIKSQAFPIRCEEEHTNLISEAFGCVVASFLYTYKGVPLALGSLSAMKPLVDKIVNHLPAWKGTLLSRCGRLILVQSILCAISVHVLMALKITPWAVKTIEILI
jgi:hypothetical protein